MTQTLTRSDKQLLLDQVIAAVDKSDLSDRQKRIYIRKLKLRPRLRDTVLDEVVAQGYGEIFIVTINAEGNAETQIDWEGLAGFLERMIPLIIQIIGIFA